MQFLRSGPARLLAAALLVFCSFGAAFAQPATSPVADPSFPSPEIYSPTGIRLARQLADGSKIFLPYNLLRAEGQAATASRIAKYTAAGSYDAGSSARFGANTFRPFIVQEAPGNKLVILNRASPSIPTLTRLNADGSRDNAFAVTLTGSVGAVLVQPDGKVVVGGQGIVVNGQAARQLLRLNADGTPDAAFNAALGTGPDTQVRVLALLPAGSLAVGGTFDAVNGQPMPALARVSGSGVVDASFAPALTNNTDVQILAAQPDGKVLVAGNGPVLFSIGRRYVVRLLTTGAIDNTFIGQTASQPLIYSIDKSDNPALVVQPDGRILVNSQSGKYNNVPVGTVYRLLPDGTLDPSFQHVVDYNTPLNELFFGTVSMQLLATGEVLVAGAQANYVGANTPTGTALLNANGSYDVSFAPQMLREGDVMDLLLQPDGKMIIGGNFTEIGGASVRHLARLNANGALDAAFSAACPTDAPVFDLELQPDGKAVAGGYFTQVGAARQVQRGVARFLTSGLPDNTFNCGIGLPKPLVTRLARQPDGQLLVNGAIGLSGGTDKGLVRLTATGQLDRSFAPPAALERAAAVLVQPDGRILVGALHDGNGFNWTNSLVRLLPSGALDPAFSLIVTNSNITNNIQSFALYPDGRILVGGFFGALGAWPSPYLLRLLANGSPDGSFTSGLLSPADGHVTIQPNGRILVGRIARRVLPSGGLDVSFAPNPVRFERGWVVQPDGKLLTYGSFQEIAGVPRLSVARLLDPNVLAIAPVQATTRTAAYPVPAHGQLHLALDATARPQQVQLLDGRGRVVLTQATPQPDLTLNTEALAPGLYLLRVQYAGQTATRRVVLE